MNVKSLGGILLGLLALAILVLLYFKTQTVSSKEFNDVVSNLRELQRIDSDRTLEAIKIHMGISQDFDQLSQSFQVVRGLKNQLKNSDLSDPQLSSQAIYDQLNRYLTLLDEKEREIDLFKRLHGPLKNSIRFLPDAGSELIAKSRQNNQADLAQRVEVVLKDVYHFILSPKEVEKANLSQWLDTNFMQYPTGIATAAGNFVPHASLILDQKVPANAALTNILEMPSGLEAANLIDLYTLLHQSKLAEVEKYRMAMLIYAALLLISTYVGIIYFRNQSANRVASVLRESNQNLETKVEERTKELSTAYDKLKNSHARLVQSEKMAAVGQLVAGVAHEINTPLGYVTSNVELFEDVLGQVGDLVNRVNYLDQMLKRSDVDEDQIAEQFAEIDQLLKPFSDDSILGDAKDLVKDSKFGLKQISEIVMSLKGFSRLDATAEAHVDVVEGIENTLKVSQNLLKKVSRVVKNYEDIPEISCNLSQLNQVFLNLITNAVHAIEAKGQSGVIWIKTRSDRDYVYISIQDNGIGIKPEAQKRLFEPFYTTKKFGKGTGLGLTISQKIVEDHGGHLQFKSQHGKGTVFQISLPRHGTPKKTALLETQA